MSIDFRTSLEFIFLTSVLRDHEKDVLFFFSDCLLEVHETCRGNAWSNHYNHFLNSNIRITETMVCAFNSILMNTVFRNFYII